MEPTTAIDVLEREAARFVELLDGALLDGALQDGALQDGEQLEGWQLAAPVPSCPGWDLGDLAGHLGGIHRWAHHAVLVGPGEEPPGPRDPDRLRAWFAQGAAQLVELLRATPPDHPCWSFGRPPSTARFWMRRMAHETTLHRWDAETSLTLPAHLDDGLAADGVAEVLTEFVPRQLRLGRLTPGPEVIALVGPAGRTLLAARPQGLEGAGGHPPQDAEATATVTGPDAALLLLLWRRIDLSDERLAVTGSREDAERLLARPLTP